MLFFVRDQPVISRPQLNVGYAARLWRPEGADIVAQGLPRARFAIWWSLHQVRVFYNRDYGVLIIRENGQLVHRSCVFPGYLRFPFMAKNDLQIGDTWTDPAHRGLGLATFALLEIVRILARPGRRFWYLVDDANVPSIRAIEKAGFSCFARGIKRPRFGIAMLGYYSPDTIVESENLKSCCTGSR
jgi:RimJ/RimL family protein N-acetyltransferase